MKLVGYNSRMETINAFLRLTASLLVDFFARARVSVLAVVIAAVAGGGLAACGGSGGGDNPQAAGPRAYFLGANRVAGLQYQYGKRRKRRDRCARQFSA